MKRRAFLAASGAVFGAGMFGAAAAFERPTPYVLIHGAGCGKPAYLLTERPRSGGCARASMVRKLNGERVLPYTSVECGSCGKPLRLRTQDVRLA